MNTLVSLLHRLPDPGRWRFWMACALVIKAVYFMISLQQGYASSVPDTFAACSGDCPSYLDPVDHLLEHGRYAPDLRMPGYAAAYLPLRSVFAKPLAMDLLIILQILLDACATYALAHALWLFSGARAAFILGFGLYGLASTVSGFNIFILTESFCASAIVFTGWCLVRWYRHGGTGILLAAGCAATWMYFLRPVMAPCALLLLLLLILWPRVRGQRSAVLWFLLPILLLQSAWMIRNQLVHGTAHPLAVRTFYARYTATELATWRFVGTFDSASALYFFPDRSWPDRDLAMADVNAVRFPDRVFTSAFNADSLQEIRGYCALLLDTSLAPSEAARIDRIASEKLDRYTASIYREKPFMAYLGAPLDLARRHVFGSTGVYNLFLPPFRELSTPAKLLKAAHMGIYLVALYAALAFVGWSLVRWRERYWLLSAPLLYGMLIHPFLIRMVDQRYLYVSYPLMCAAAALMLLHVGRWWRVRSAR